MRVKVETGAVQRDPSAGAAPDAGPFLALERQLAAFERLDPAAQRALQLSRLERLFDHAAGHSSFWRGRLAEAGWEPGAGAGEVLARLPALTREELQTHFAAMRARPPGMGDDQISLARTSGSTGRPVEVERHAPSYAALYGALSLREHAWHGRDMDADLLVIRDAPETVQHGWSPECQLLGRHGRALSRNLVERTPEELWDWAAGQAAPYLVTTPAMARALAELALADGARRLELEQVITHGEPVTEELRGLARAAFGARVIDRYSCQEAGWIAFQCPRHDHLHVQSAAMLAEIVDETGRACAPGESGRVLLTALHSHAMPLIRYDIGDVAEQGGACDCGITLPVIARVHGRTRSFLLCPDGSLRLARMTGDHWTTVAPVREHRVVQYADGLVEAFVTAPRPLSGDEQAGLAAMLKQVLHPGLEILVTQVERIDWPSRWKRDDFVRLDRLREG